jgi:hypothetical protein
MLMQIAVLTADVVHSTQLSAPEEKGLQASLKELYAGQRLEFYRGDSFQAAVQPVSEALRLALRARAFARSLGNAYDIRISIGIGKVPGPVKSLSSANGEAFLLSGRSFDELKDEQRLAIRGTEEGLNVTFRILAAYCDHLFRNLTARQAAVVGELLAGRTQTEAAAALGITQATISAHAGAASWPEIESLLHEYETITASLSKTS